jgi:hypothetical protein
MLIFKYLFILSSLILSTGKGCPDGKQNNIPPDFLLSVDVKSAGEAVQHLNIRITAEGKGQYDRYKTGGVIREDNNNMITYNEDQVLESGEFLVKQDEMKKLWGAITENHFFELTNDYRMAIGHSYAFIIVEAEERRHRVFNIGMEVPQIWEIIKAIEMVLPDELDLEYREGYVP